MTGLRSVSSMPVAMATVGLIIAFCTLHVFIDHRFFYWDDVQHTFAPVFYSIGDRLRSGDWPTSTLLLWQGGFLAGEGLYQVFNPISLAIFALLPGITNIATGMALHATVWLVIAGLGTFGLALRLGASAQWAGLAGFSYASSPFLVYWLAASWINGAIGFAALAWALFFLASRRPSMVDALGLAFASYLVGVSGWIHAIVPLTLFGSVRVLAPDAENSLRSRIVFLTALAAGALLASPQLLATVASVQGSMRPSNISNNGTAVADLQGIATAFWPAYAQETDWFLKGAWGPPLYYGAWFMLPAAFFAAHHRRTLLADYRWLFWPSLVILIATLGPDQLGPTRWPLRFLPAAWVAMIPISAAVLSRYQNSAGRGSTRVTAIALFLAAILTWQQLPDREMLLVCLCLLIGAMSLLVMRPTQMLSERARSVLLLLGTVVISCWMAAEYPINSAFGNYFGPERRDDVRVTGVQFPDSIVQIYTRQVNDKPRAKAGLATLGNVTSWDEIPMTYDESMWLPSGNMPLFRRERLLNGYSPVEMMSLKVMTCGQSIFGWTCDSPLPTLLAIERKTGVTFADLMRIGAIVVSPRMKVSMDAIERLPGWSIQRPSPYAVIARRQVPASSQPGTVSHVPDGAQVISAPIVTDDRERLVIRREPGFSGGMLAFARAYYPGHSIEIDGRATPVEKLGGVVLAVPIPAGEGTLTLDLRHELPMPVLWRFCVALGLGLLLTSLWIARREPAGGAS